MYLFSRNDLLRKNGLKSQTLPIPLGHASGLIEDVAWSKFAFS